MATERPWEEFTLRASQVDAVHLICQALAGELGERRKKIAEQSIETVTAMLKKVEPK